MSWSHPIQSVRFAHMRAANAEAQRHWHVAVQHYLYCFEKAHQAQDARAIRFFAAKLAVAYKAMGMRSKASYYAAVAD